MGFLNLAVKYRKNPVIDPDWNFELPESPSISGLTAQYAEADKPTALLKNDTEIIFDDKPIVKENPVRKVISGIKPSKGLNVFSKFYDQAVTEDPELSKYRDVFTRLAQRESTFNSSAKNPNAPAYGYFQFMEGNYNGRQYNNISRLAKTDVKSFLSNPVAQIHAAKKLAQEFMHSFSNKELDQLHKLGWTDNAILAGSWLGGPGNVKRLAFRGIDSSDGADSVAKRMRDFNY